MKCFGKPCVPDPSQGDKNVSVLRSGAASPVRDETVKSWDKRALEITRGSKPENVSNMDETGVFWRGLPEKTLSEYGRRCSGGKIDR